MKPMSSSQSHPCLGYSPFLFTIIFGQSLLWGNEKNTDCDWMVSFGAASLLMSAHVPWFSRQSHQHGHQRQRPGRPSLMTNPRHVEQVAAAGHGSVTVGEETPLHLMHSRGRLSHLIHVLTKLLLNVQPVFHVELPTSGSSDRWLPTFRFWWHFNPCSSQSNSWEKVVMWL